MLITAMLILAASPVWGADSDRDYDLKSKPKVRVERSRSAPKRVRERHAPAVPAVPLVPKVAEAKAETSVIRWGGALGYGLRTDLADRIKPRLYTHTLDISYGFAHLPSQVTVAAVISGAFESAGERRSEILLDDDRTEMFVNDFALAVQKTADAFWDTKLEFTLANEFPSSPEARREGYGSVTSVEGRWIFPLNAKQLMGSLSSEIYYVWNEYKYSPATGDLNKQGGWRNVASLRWTVWRGLFASVSAGTQLSRYLDGTNDVTYRNAFTTGYQWSRVTATFGLSNGTYLNQEDANVWFIDEYRRMLSMSLRFSF